MKAYRIRKKSTGLFWRGAGNGGQGKWVSAGKLYLRPQDAKAALTAYARGIIFGSDWAYDKEHQLTWRIPLTPIQIQERKIQAESSVEKALSDVEVLVFDLDKGKALSVEEFRGNTS